MARPFAWDTELYEAQHSFVWKMGEELVALLNPKTGETILDLGCGTGQLTSSIAASGASVVGLDSSADMIGQARQNYPRLRFVLESAATMSFQQEFDAVFSNAALHWMLDARTVVQNIARALRPKGRFVAEFGGKGNIQRIESAVQAVLRGYADKPLPESQTYFPSVSEYTGLLEDCGFEVRLAELYDRPTPLEGDRGMEQWIRQFLFYYFDVLEDSQRAPALEQAVAELRPELYEGGKWTADYRRIRVVAWKV